MGEFAVGQGVSRFEDPRLLRGGGRYIDDLKLPGMAHGVVVRAQHAHAKIVGIDTTAAKAAPGVLAVLTAADIKAAGLADIPVPGGLKRRDGTPMYKPRYPILAETHVRWVGDAVAFVVAETVAQAQDAAEMVVVDYDELPAVVSTAEAPKPGTPKVWADAPDNICFVELIGDKAATDAAFANAAHVVKGEFVINRVTAATMEPRGAAGHYNAADGRYTFYGPMQRPHPTRTELAQVMRVPESKIRIVTGDTGGSFGMKSPIFNETPLVLLASKLTGRPVKWISTRTEAFLSDAQARDNITTAELALDKDGMFLGLRVQTIAAIGAYLQTATPAFVLNAGTLAGVYRTPAIHVDITAVYTHTNPVRPYRGNGRPEAAFVIERMVDLAARQLGIDGVELRKRNFITPSAMPYKTALTFTYDSGDFEKATDMAVEMADVKGFAARKAEAQKRGKLRGLGLSYTIERAGAASLEGAEVRIDKSGTATLFSGSNSQGQGHETVFKQLVCDRLGLDPNEAYYIQGDTDEVFFGEGTGGSRSSSLAGSAFHLATEKIVTKARAIAAHMLQIEEADLKFDEGVFSSTKTNRTLTIKELAAAALEPKNVPKGMEPGLLANAIYTAPVANYPNGCHICEVEIDPETGKTDIVRYNVVDDVGTVLNPKLLHGQIHGGIAQGAGQVLMEDIHFDASGQLVTASFQDYAMPHAHDFPDMEVESCPAPTPTNPLGVKGAGEAGAVGAMPAVSNAIVDALAEFGVTHIEMPATPERVWRAIQR
ncbi:xanthine dehydrogenase family protein molybdopterin-binding subunit [Pseudolabrys taiwanensis]|uniref:Xanthine dehydrogenase family protein molybdopterin-binding subunit n=1 Tax=Pseudolabrys taiwanensis TaxID=331696 RepID=A0A345ZTK8_9HYPH|nr:xanthine dehydrogenase family protein molybdopterin-binding subunit [Pseudolabrys taiwanensis]AXK80255.1 xanthine dehydrogenase family protein molybdopterin-binding subunit [Pseudolabrys taiwanensis]